MTGHSVDPAILLGPNFRPGPANVNWAEASTPNGKMHIMIIDHSAGRTAIAFDDDGLQNLENMIRERRTGLSIAKVTPMPNGRYTPPQGAG